MQSTTIQKTMNTNMEAKKSRMESTLGFVIGISNIDCFISPLNLASKLSCQTFLLSLSIPLHGYWQEEK